MVGILSLNEAKELLPELILQTEETVRNLSRGKKILDQMLLPENEQEKIETRMVELFSLWVSWVQLHGGHVKGPWMVDFDNGRGYWCWQFGETDIGFQHNYDEGHEKRRPVDDLAGFQREEGGPTPESDTKNP